MELEIEIRLAPGAKIPTRAYESDAAWDLYALSRTDNHEKYVEYDTGVRIAIPNGFVGLVFPRSSVREKSLMLTNGVGVIDPGYRGSIKASFRDFRDPHYHVYNPGDKVAQIIIIPRPTLKFRQVDELPEADRGERGHGSSGN